MESKLKESRSFQREQRERKKTEGKTLDHYVLSQKLVKLFHIFNPESFISYCKKMCGSSGCFLHSEWKCTHSAKDSKMHTRAHYRIYIQTNV